MNLTNNSFMILEKLYYDGLEDEAVIVQIYAIKLIFRVLEETPNILAKKSSVSIIKLILEKIIRLTNSLHTNLAKNVNLTLNSGQPFFASIVLPENIKNG